MGGHKVEGMEEVPVRLFGQVQVEGMRLREAHISGRIGVNDDVPASSADVRVCAPIRRWNLSSSSWSSAGCVGR